MHALNITLKQMADSYIVPITFYKSAEELAYLQLLEKCLSKLKIVRLIMRKIGKKFVCVVKKNDKE